MKFEIEKSNNLILKLQEDIEKNKTRVEDVSKENNELKIEIASLKKPVIQEKTC